MSHHLHSFLHHVKKWAGLGHEAPGSSSLPLGHFHYPPVMQPCIITSDSGRGNILDYLLVTRASYSQEFKYASFVLLFSLKQANGTFQSSVQLFSLLILVQVVILAAYMAKDQCETQSEALLQQCFKGTAEQVEAT